MTRSFLVPLVCLALVQADPAYGDETTDSRDIGTTSNSLDRFVGQAIDGGLLEPSTDVQAEPPEPSDEELCKASRVLDFSDLAHLTSYQDAAALAKSTGEDAAKKLAAARGFLALGLVDEASLILNSVDLGEQGRALNSLAGLLSERRRTNLSYFRSLSGCRGSADLWLSLGLIEDNKLEGRDLIEDRVSEYRALPFQLKVLVATRAIPLLDRIGDHNLAQRLLASFSEADIASSSRLQFTKALVDLHAGDEGAQNAIQGFVSDPAFQTRALLALAQFDQGLPDGQRAVLLDTLIKLFEQADDERQTAGRLAFALHELSAASNYPLMLDLKDLPSLQFPQAQAEIQRVFADSVARDLSSDDKLRALKAIAALVNSSGFLMHEEEMDGLYANATGAAVSLGLTRLSTGLFESSAQPKLEAARLARLAYRDGDYDQVQRYAKSFSDDPDIILLAALSALHLNDTPRLRYFERELANAQGALVTLIEEDALVGGWQVSPRIYKALHGLEEAELKQRADLVLKMWRTDRQPDSKVPPVTLVGAGEKLAQSGRVLSQFQSEEP